MPKIKKKSYILLKVEFIDDCAFMNACMRGACVCVCVFVNMHECVCSCMSHVCL